MKKGILPAGPHGSSLRVVSSDPRCNGGGGLGGDCCEQLRDGLSQYRVKKSRIEITQGNQNKGALRQTRMGDDEVKSGAAFGKDLLSKKEQVEVDGPRALWNRPTATKRGLDLLTDRQQPPGIPSRSIDRQNHIEKAGLVEVANRVCLVERGEGSHGETMIEQSPDSLQEVGSPVPKIGSKPQIDSL